jgi:uncharacterized membrane protein
MLAPLLAMAILLISDAAKADFRLCNNTSGRVGIAVGYKENDGWTTEGWWNLPARSCETVLRGTLVARFYYIYALDYDRGGEWSGQAFMCTRDKEFTIRGTDDCLARGYDRTGFFEVDTGDQPSWTVQLTESGEHGPQRVPGLPQGEMPGAPDSSTQSWIAVGLIVVIVLILSFGGTIERMLEYFAWTMLGVVFLFLVVVNVAFVPAAHWASTLVGFFSFSGLPHPIDWGLIGALAATAGSGGIGNLTVTNWMRDKGFGMASKVGAIPSAVGGHSIQLSHVGTVFPASPENLARWREWLRYVHTDQIWVWGLFCFVGMFLNVNLATAIIPHGTNLQGLAAGAYQAEYLAKIWKGFWFLTLFNGFWILFKTQLGNSDVLVRTITDAVWMSDPRARAGKRGIRALYYGILAAFSIWGIVMVRSASPFQLFKVLANMAGLVLVIAGIQIFLVNRRFLPRALRPSPWREAGLLACVAFYAFFAWFGLSDVVRNLFK